jgi:hypothetical protein
VWSKEKTKKGGDGSRCELEEHEEEGDGSKHKPKLLNHGMETSSFNQMFQF